MKNKYAFLKNKNYMIIKRFNEINVWVKEEGQDAYPFLGVDKTYSYTHGVGFRKFIERIKKI